MNDIKFREYALHLRHHQYDQQYEDKVKKSFNGMTREQALRFLRWLPDRFDILPNQFQTQEYELVSKL